jgi:hypothetical protein
MGHDSSISEAANGTGVVGQAAPGHSVRDVGPAPMVDVMFDQLEYLLAHKSRGCPRGCGSCKRLKQVENWLLLPFRTTGSGSDFGGRHQLSVAVPTSTG